MIPDYLSMILSLAGIAYTIHTTIDIYFILRDYRETKQPGQPGGLYQ
jgi:hypothetical protein